MNEVDIAVAILKQGGVVCYPTDTVYGLGGAAFLPSVAKRIYTIKGRPQHKALPLLIACVPHLSKIVEDIPPVAKRLIDSFWPGALTIIFTKSPLVPDEVCPQPTLAIRMPNHEVPLSLIHELGMPIIGTSANLSGRPACTTPDEVRAQLGGKVDWIVKGHCPAGRQSTVIDVSGAEPHILREGAIRREEIESVIGPIQD